MKGKDAVNDGVDRLAVVEGVGDKAEVARRGGGMEAEMGDWRGVGGHQLRADAGGTTYSRGSHCISPLLVVS